MFQVTKECVMWPCPCGAVLITKTENQTGQKNVRCTQRWGILWWKQKKQGVGLRGLGGGEQTCVQAWAEALWRVRAQY